VQKSEIFIKYSPLIDPIKYMVGKYKNIKSGLFDLPHINKQHICSKTDDNNNSAYIDSFFSFLTNKLLESNNFINGSKFYGSYLANKADFKINIYDDIEYLDDSTFFNENKDTLFKIDKSYYDELYHNDSRNHKKHISIGSNINLDCVENFNHELVESIFASPTKENIRMLDISNNLIYNSPITPKSDDSSSCSSRESNTSNEKSDDDDEDNTNENTEDSESSSVSNTDSDFQEDEENIFAYINNFPVDIICLESCDETLDHYMMNNDIENDEWETILFQIIMTLITYQKAFSFTHNDLHTNNIMHIKTDKKYIAYKYNDIYYKVKTFGKIWKIIDFGRAIYKFQGKTLCSDSFHPLGDAATQYNCEPYFNENKQKLEPNNSFDLCRLGCSLFDYFLDEPNEAFDTNNLDSIQKLVIEWCQDDNFKNILYKKSGEERYPEFKLYKMISRNVHNHTPQKQLERSMFSKFSHGKLGGNKKVKIIDIDSIQYQG